ncbi:AAA domain-containing protein [Kiritimatiellaeota bacterium B1221]|nr:AAA domain-containing protein [Kiritimatiellaeota bacterium B1221]
MQNNGDIPDLEKGERFLNTLENEIRREEQVAKRDRVEFLSRPLPDRVQSGWSLSPVSLQRSKEDPKLLELHTDLSKSRYREGDVLRIHTTFIDDVDGFDATIVWEGSDYLLICPETSPDAVLSSAGILTADPGYLNLTNYYLSALEDCGATTVGRELILPMLVGELQLELEGHLYDEALDEAEVKGLNEAQADAFASCVACSHAYYVQGPPGTGKTRVLAEVVRTLVERGERVWVSALTHRAINHALSAVKKTSPHTKLARITDEKNEVPPGIDVYGFIHKSPLADEAGGYAIGATPFVGMTSRLRDWECDTLLIDEASQVTLPLALMAMLKAKRILLFGDDQQLPPIQVSCPLAKCSELSILNRIPLSDMHTRLNVTYRMHPDLCEWPSRQFYDSELQSHSSTATQPTPFSDLPNRCFWVRSFSIKQEVESITRTVLKLLSDGARPPDTIAVLTPFRSHARKIRNALRAQNLQVRVDTVERMQGQECEFVLFALGIEDTKRVLTLADFIFHPQKLNVAITRAKSGVILFAHPVLLQTKMFGVPGTQQRIWQDLFTTAKDLNI